MRYYLIVDTELRTFVSMLDVNNDPKLVYNKRKLTKRAKELTEAAVREKLYLSYRVVDKIYPHWLDKKRQKKLLQ